MRRYRQVNCRKLVELADEYLQTPPITGRYHFVCCLALLSLQSQARGNSHRDIEELFAERGITVSREAIRLWCIKFGAIYTRRLKRRHLGYGDTFYIDEVFVKINDKQYENSRAEQSHEAISVRERGMRKFKSMGQAQRFATAHAAGSNLFNLGRLHVRAQHYLDLRTGAFGEWSRAHEVSRSDSFGFKKLTCRYQCKKWQGFLKPSFELGPNLN